MFDNLKRATLKKSPFFYALNKDMRKILIQYTWILVLILVAFCIHTVANSCENIEKDKTPICLKDQLSTKEIPCEDETVNINTLSNAINKLGESGVLPK